MVTSQVMAARTRIVEGGTEEVRMRSATGDDAEGIEQAREESVARGRGGGRGR